MLLQKKLPGIFWNYWSAYNSDTLTVLYEANYFKYNPNYNNIYSLRRDIKIKGNLAIS
jgi:hypothetical protein